MNMLTIIDFKAYCCKEDWSPAVAMALKACAPGDTLRFPKGTYHFHAGRCREEYLFIANHDHGLKRIAFDLDSRENLTIDGDGSDFIFHGRVTPFAVRTCKHVTIKNLSVDYERPFFTEGEVTEADHNHVDLKIDKDKYPYRIDEGQMVFCDPDGGWESSYIKWFIEFDPVLHRPAWAKAGSDTRTQKIRAEQLNGDTVRFKADFKEIHAPGSIVNMTHEMRHNPGIFLDGSQDIVIENVMIHHAGAMGVIGQNSRDISLKNYKVHVKEGSGRMVSTNNDASHFVNCEGLIKLEDCTLRHQLDDGVNIHGIYSVVSRVLPGGFLELEAGHFQQNGVNVYRPGDKIALVDRQTHLNKGCGTVMEAETVNQQFFLLKVDWDEGTRPQVTDGISNYQRLPEISIRGCEFRDNRARGILASSNKKILIEDNDFYTSGSSICCGGEMGFWFESGPVKDLTVRNNRFHDCGYAKWGRALISVNTQLAKVPREEFLHENFSITDNSFDIVEPPLLYALSTKGIEFSRNRLNASRAFTPHKDGTVYLETESCRDLVIKDNILTGIDEEALCE